MLSIHIAYIRDKVHLCYIYVTHKYEISNKYKYIINLNTCIIIFILNKYKYIINLSTCIIIFILNRYK